MSTAFDVENIAPGSHVDLYISPTCPYCAAAIEHYRKAGTSYAVHDAENQTSERRRMFEYTGGDPTVPAIVVDGRYVQSGWGTPPRG